MKGKNVVILGIGATIGFASCGVMMTKRILSSDEMRNALKRIISDKIEHLLYGEVTCRRNSKVSYRSYYDSQKYCEFDSKEVIFESRKEAEDVLNGVIERYGFISIADFYDLCKVGNCCTHPSSSRKYGWVNVDGCTTVRVKGGYIINLPEPMKIS